MTKNAEIYYLIELIKASKVLYYNGLACLNDETYDTLENRLRKLDPTNDILEQPGWKKEWVKNDGYQFYNNLKENLKKVTEENK